MPSYPYFCKKCETETDYILKIEELNNAFACTNCGNILESSDRRIAKQSIIADIEPYFCHGLGTVVKSRSHRNHLAKAKNLIEVGTENINKIHHKYDEDRRKKIEKRWSDFENDTIYVRS